MVLWMVKCRSECPRTNMPSTETVKMLQINNLSATVGDKPILMGLSLTVNACEIHAIMGPNGAGKSTLAYVLGGRPGYDVTGGSVCPPDMLEIVTQQVDVAGIDPRDNIPGLRIIIGSVIGSFGAVEEFDVDRIARNASQPFLRFVDLLQPAAMGEVKLPVTVQQVRVLGAENPVKRSRVARNEPFVDKPLKINKGPPGILFGPGNPHPPVLSAASFGETPGRNKSVPRIARDRKPRQRKNVFWCRIKQIDQGEMADKPAKQRA